MPEIIIGGIGPISNEQNLASVLIHVIEKIPEEMISVGVKPNPSGGCSIKMKVELHIDTTLNALDSGDVAVKKLLDSALRVAVALRAGAKAIEKGQGVVHREDSNASENKGTPDAEGGEDPEAPEALRDSEQSADPGGPGDQEQHPLDGAVGPPDQEVSLEDGSLN